MKALCALLHKEAVSSEPRYSILPGIADFAVGRPVVVVVVASAAAAAAVADRDDLLLLLLLLFGDPVGLVPFEEAFPVGREVVERTLADESVKGFPRGTVLCRKTFRQKKPPRAAFVPLDNEDVLIGGGRYWAVAFPFVIA